MKAHSVGYHNVPSDHRDSVQSFSHSITLKLSVNRATFVKVPLAMASEWWSSETIAVVTGANKGIGHEIVRQLASKGITVVLTARDENRGRAAVEGLHSQGLQNVDFHTLDISVPESIKGFANWLKGKYGGVHILVNNAAIGNFGPFTAELAIKDVKTNYEGSKGITEALLPLMGDGARVVILTSLHGQLCYLEDESLREQLSDPSKFTEATVDEIAERYYAACHKGEHEAVSKFAPLSYQVSKILVTAYGRALAKRLEKEQRAIYVNMADPGVVRTDAYDPAYGPGVPVDEGADTSVWLALQPIQGGPTGGFFYLRESRSFVGEKFVTVDV